jgi:predicted nucleic acid-binding Zn ribbon protein
VTRRRAPRPAASAFAAALAHAAPRTALATVQAAWPGIVGKRVAAAASPAAEQAGTLTVECVDGVWVEELNLMQAQVLERLREELGDDAPEALRFRLARDP